MPTTKRWWPGALQCKNDADDDADQRDEISYAERHSFPLSQTVNRIEIGEGRSKCLEVSLAGLVLRKHHRALRLVCQLPLGLRSFVRVFRSWTPAGYLPDAVADRCEISNANPGKSFEQIGGASMPTSPRHGSRWRAI